MRIWEDDSCYSCHWSRSRMSLGDCVSEDSGQTMDKSGVSEKDSDTHTRPNEISPPSLDLEKERAQQRRDKLVRVFVYVVETYFKKSYLVMEGKESRDNSEETSLGGMVGMGAGALITGLLGAPSVGGAIGSMAGQKVEDAIRKKKLNRLSLLIYYMQERQEREIIRKILTESATVIFNSFEQQLMEVSCDGGWPVAVKKMAEDAAHRLINFCSQIKAEEINSEIVTKGVVQGKSKKQFWCPWKRGLKIRYNGENVTTKSIYENTGLVTLNSDGMPENYYRTLYEKCDTSKYGHRLLFSWEMNDSGKIEPCLEKRCSIEEKPKNQYLYVMAQEFIRKKNKC